MKKSKEEKHFSLILTETKFEFNFNLFRLSNYANIG